MVLDVVEEVCVVAELAVVTLGVLPPQDVRKHIAAIHKSKNVLKNFFILICFLVWYGGGFATLTV